MSLIFSTIIPFLSIASILILLLAAFRFIQKEKLAESILKLPEANRERFLRYEKNMVRLLKISLWPALILLIMFPLATFLYFRQYFLAATVWIVLFFIVVLQEYRFRKWLIDYLEAGDILK